MIEIQDVKANVLVEVLRDMYTDQVENMEKVATELLSAADNYAMNDLKSECAQYLCKNMNVENAIEIFEVAEKHNVAQLKENALRFIKLHVTDMIKKGVFEAESKAKKIRKSTLLEIIRVLS